MSSLENSVKVRNCRICLVANSDSPILFDIDSEWSRLFEYCVGIHVIDNNAPRVLCVDCAEKLSEYAKFKESCLKSDTLWSSISKTKLNCSKSNIKVEIKEEVINIEDDYSDFHTYEDNFTNINDVEEGTYVKVETIEPDIPTYLKKKVPLQKEVTKRCTKRRTTEVDDTCNVNEDEKVPNKRDFILKYFEDVTVEKMGPDKSRKIAKTKLECCKCGIQYKHFNISKERCNVLLHHIKKCYNLEELHYEKKKEIPKKPPSPLYYCGLCELKSPDSDLIRQHVREHYANDQFDCKLCDFKGRDIADIVAHRYKHHPPEFSHKILCTECPKKIGAVLKLEFHIRSEHLKKKGGWCSVCNFTTKIYITIRNHVRLHQGDKFVCDCCGRNFLNRNKIKAHLMDQSDIKNYVCDTCGKSFKRVSQLQGHKDRIHVYTTPVVCTHCNKSFKSKITLKDHMKWVNREKKYICNVCAKGFGILSELKSHMFWHTGEKPHKCEICGNRYKAKSQLKIHMRIHSGHRPFKCAICDKAFTSSQQYNVHQAVHTGKRRNKCPFCDRTFNWKKLMLNHCKSAHQIDGTSLNCK